ncbi:DoxX family membrane protein [Miniimonas arenae]|uniref:DoxX family membrane protein n=1 Tax=Miniimonas arenae TaxID=676201 RepID=A0A5C5BA94_9MICO|nr:DoxX family membrane protein [Miniimonas arenae]TNU72952.1 DoxX family membrane protein [Miniimonas arenae]
MASLRNIPLRLTTGAFILNSGIGKTQLDAESAAGLQAMAARAFPQLGQIKAEEFGKLLAAGELALGSALLAPFIPARLAGLGLTAFSSALLWMYHKTPGATVDGVRPTQDGTGLAKDVFLLGAGLSLLIGSSKKS